VQQARCVVGARGIADRNIAHRLRDASRWRLAVAANAGELTAARISLRDARLGRTVFCSLKPPPNHVGPDRRHLFAHRGDQAVASLDLRLERRLFRLTLPRQRGIDVGRIGAGRKEALDVVADPAMRVMAQPAVALVARPGLVVWHARWFRLR
jgi:hypothetical protein